MIDSEETVLLVDADDRLLGAHDKLDAHRLGLRHRAFSVFLSDSAGRLVIQQRASGKYHSAGLWANACCGHPRAGETVAAAARRRLGEELGVDVALRPAGQLAYRAALGSGWHENEIVHLFTGATDRAFSPDPAEVSRVRCLDPQQLAREMRRSPGRFAAWFLIYADAVPALAFGQPGLRIAA